MIHQVCLNIQMKTSAVHTDCMFFVNFIELSVKGKVFSISKIVFLKGSSLVALNILQ
jgi:hypothetical protein